MVDGHLSENALWLSTGLWVLIVVYKQNFFKPVNHCQIQYAPKKQSDQNSKGTLYRQSYTMMQKLALTNIILSNESV